MSILRKISQIMDAIWGFDLGGTKIEGIILNKEDHSVVTRLRIPTEGHRDMSMYWIRSVH